MGGVAFKLGYRRVSPKHPVDGAALLAAVWGHIAGELRRRVRSNDGKSIVQNYLAMEAEDGLSSGDWSAAERALMLTFGDAAGGCVREMEVSKHFVEMVVLDAIDALQNVAGNHGAALSLPKRERDALLDGLRRGDCACEVCRGIRVARGLAPVADTKATKPTVATKAKRTKKAAESAPPTMLEPRWSLFDAPVHVGPDTKAVRADRAGMVVIDLDRKKVPKKPPRAVFEALSTCPVRALRASWHPMRSIWPELSMLSGLEVLSLPNCNQREPIGPALMAFPELRAVDLSGSQLWEIYEGARLPPNLEILDEPFRGPWAHEVFRDTPKLRSVGVSGFERFPEPLYALPIDTLSIHFDCEIDRAAARAWPLRYVETAHPHAFEGTCVEFLAVAERWQVTTLPESVQAFPKLRALHVTGVLTELPDWLAELPHLEMLFLPLSGMAANPSAFRVLERMKRLRVLVLTGHDTDALPLDLAGCEALEVFAVPELRATTEAALPRGLELLPRLRACVAGGGVSYSVAMAWQERVPAVRRDGAFYAGHAIDYYRMSLPRDSYDHFLSRWGWSAYTDLLAP